LYRFYFCIKLQNFTNIELSVTSLEMHSKVPYSLTEIYPAPFLHKFQVSRLFKARLL